MRSNIAGALVILAALGCAPDRRAPDVAFISWDSARADHLSAYGYPRPTTPRLEALVRQATRFDQAFSQHNWTRPSYHALLTGRHNWELPGRRLSLEVPLLQEALRGAGYRTLALVQNPNLSAEFGFDRGFDHYERLDERLRPAAVQRRALELLAAQPADGPPLFLFLHFQGPHYPLPASGAWVDAFLRGCPQELGPREITHILSRSRELPGGDDRGLAERCIVDLYDAALAETDQTLVPLLAALDRRADASRRERLLVFTADHGEELGDRSRFGHAHENLYPELTRVPLIVQFPARLAVPPGRVGALVRLIDLFPTVLALAAAPPPEGVSGRSLLPLDALDRQKRLSISNIGQRVVLRNERWALHLDEAGAVVSIHNRRNDPQERVPVAPETDDPGLQRLRAAAEAWRLAWQSEPESAEGKELSRELTESLRALGYLN